MSDQDGVKLLLPDGLLEGSISFADIRPTRFNIADAVVLHLETGKVEVNPKYSTDEAAKVFWEAVCQLAPKYFCKP